MQSGLEQGGAKGRPEAARLSTSVAGSHACIDAWVLPLDGWALKNARPLVTRWDRPHVFVMGSCSLLLFSWSPVNMASIRAS